MSKVIAIFGFGPGTATAVADRFGSEGFSIALIGRDEQRLASGVDALSSRGITAVSFVGDAGDPSSIRDVIGLVRSRMGPITVVHWNAYGGLDAGDLLAADSEALRHVFDVAVFGLLAATNAALSDLKANAGAVMISNGAFGEPSSAMNQAAVSAKTMGLAIASAAKNKLAGMLAERLKADGVFVGEVMVHAAIKGTPSGSGDSIDPSVVAEEHWRLYRLRDETRADVRLPTA